MRLKDLSDIIINDICTLRNKNVYFVVDFNGVLKLINKKNSKLTLTELYKKDFTSIVDDSLDIVKVQRPTNKEQLSFEKYQKAPEVWSESEDYDDDYITIDIKNTSKDKNTSNTYTNNSNSNPNDTVPVTTNGGLTTTGYLYSSYKGPVDPRKTATGKVLDFILGIGDSLATEENKYKKSKKKEETKESSEKE